MTRTPSCDESPFKFCAKADVAGAWREGGNEVTLCCFPRRAEDDKQRFQTPLLPYLASFIFIHRAL